MVGRLTHLTRARGGCLRNNKLHQNSSRPFTHRVRLTPPLLVRRRHRDGPAFTTAYRVSEHATGATWYLRARIPAHCAVHVSAAHEYGSFVAADRRQPRLLSALGQLLYAHRCYNNTLRRLLL